MACKKPEINEKLLAYLENLLKSEEKTEVEAHISECSICKEELSGLSEVNKLLAGYSSKEDAVETSCPPADILLKYSHQEGIPESVNTKIIEHLKVCPICPGIVTLLKENIRSYPVKEEYNKDLQLPDSLRSLIKEKYPCRETAEEKEELKKPVFSKAVPGIFTGLFRPVLAFAAVLLILIGGFFFIKNSYDKGRPSSTTAPIAEVTSPAPPSIAMRDTQKIQPEHGYETRKPSVKSVSPAPSPEEKNMEKTNIEGAKKTEFAKTKEDTEKFEMKKSPASIAGKGAEGKSEMGISPSYNKETAAATSPEPSSSPEEKPKFAAKQMPGAAPAAPEEATRTLGISNVPEASAPAGSAAGSLDKSSKKDLEEKNLQKKAQEAADKIMGSGRATVKVSVAEEAIPGREKKTRKVNVVVTLEKSAAAEEINKVKEAIKNSLCLEAVERENINFIFISK